MPAVDVRGALVEKAPYTTGMILWTLDSGLALALAPTHLHGIECPPMPLTCSNRAVPAAPSEPPHTSAPELFLIFDGNRTGPGGRLATVHSVRAQRSRAEDVHRSPVISQRSYVQPPIVIASPTIASASAISGRPHG